MNSKARALLAQLKKNLELRNEEYGHMPAYFEWSMTMLRLVDQIDTEMESELASKKILSKAEEKVLKKIQNKLTE